MALAKLDVLDSRKYSWYISLIGLAERFRTSTPPNIRLCVHCLKAIFSYDPPPLIEATTHLQLGNILYEHTKNTEQAKMHLEKAWSLSSTISHWNNVCLEAASILAHIYDKHLQTQKLKLLLRRAIDLSFSSPYWHCRLLFQLAQIHVREKDFGSAKTLMSVGAEFVAGTGVSSDYTHLLFLLSRGMLALVDWDMQVVSDCMSMSGSMIEQYSGSSSHRECLKVFFLVLQVCHFLMAGQVKSVKPMLKQLQHSIQKVAEVSMEDEPDQMAGDPVEQFQWLPKEHMFVLVYLVTVMHSMQAGYMDKAQKYTDKALMQIEKLKMLDSHPLLHTFQLMLLENIIMCRLIVGHKSVAVQEISQLCQVCHQQPWLFALHGAQIHTLLGLYAMSMNCMEAAEAQLKTALEISTSDQLCELPGFLSLNLAIVYMRMNRHQDLLHLLKTVSPESFRSQSHCVKTAAFFVKGLQFFFLANYADAKRYLREALKMANAEDVNRLTACSLVLLGHIFLSLGSNEEAMNLVTPAMQLASKIPDVHVQLWASSLLKDLYHVMGDEAKQAESYQMHTSFSQALLKDHFQSSQLPEHGLIQWTEGPCPTHPYPLTGNSNLSH